MIRNYLMATALSALTAGAALAGSTDGEVRLGVLTDMSATYADVAGTGSALAARMAIEDFGGKVLGKPIQFVQGDHQGKADLGSTIARDWIDNGKIDMISDLSNSAVALAVQGLAQEKGIINIMSNGATELATGERCSPTGVQWTYDTYSAGKTIATALAKEKGDGWFFVVLDNIAGESLQKGTERFILPAGAKVVGSVKHPINSADMSSYLLSAQASGAKYVAFGNAGADLVTAVKQAHEFGLTAGGQQLVGIVTFLTDIKAIGIELAQGMVYATAFFPDQSPEAREWSDRFFARHGAMPNDGQAGVYSSVLHYLKAVEAAGTDEPLAVMAKMRELPVNDMFTKNGYLREDGRMVHDTFLVQVKTPGESTGPWDLVKLVETIPGDQAFRPLDQGGCPLVKK